MSDIELIKELLENQIRAVENAIEKTVNGKIRRLDAKLDAHMKSEEEFKINIEPFLQGIRGIKVLRSTAIWVAGTVVAIGSAIMMWKSIFK